jgi:hypothetical protein
MRRPLSDSESSGKVRPQFPLRFVQSEKPFYCACTPPLKRFLQKRGCAEICPTGKQISPQIVTLGVYFYSVGVLVSGKGTRFILANTEQLHGKIHEMSERIRVLEDALGSAHRKYEGHIRSCPSQEQYAGVDDEEVEDQIPSHPLLKQELLNVKSTMGLYTASGASGSSQGNTKPPELASGQRSGGQAMDVDLSSDRERASSEDTITVPDVHTGDQVCLPEQFRFSPRLHSSYLLR